MMSKKAMQQLITDFRRVGSQVVFASPTRLLLQTSKQEVENAYAYAQYILKSIQQKPLFHFLGLEVKDYWDVLIWYDAYNYGGKGTSAITEETTKSTLETVVHWQLSQFLPLPLQPVFDDWAITFIELMQSLKRPASATGGSDSSTPRPTQLPSAFISLTEDPTSMEVTTVLQDDFSKPLKKQITSLIRRQREELLHPELASDWTFPSLPGGTLESSDQRHPRDPVLELVKALVQIVSLSKPLQLEARLLRKELLALFDVREFGKEARFENPSASLRIDNLVCDTCTMTRDLDLCRDEDILPDLASGEQDGVNKPWRCLGCRSEYDKIALEEGLIARAQATLLSWQVQDLKCKKCGTLQGDDAMFADHCACGGEWVGVMDRAEIRANLKVMQRVSSAYGLRMLAGVVEGIKGLCLMT
jgi:DNA polymerase epsilon subunit 1